MVRWKTGVPSAGRYLVWTGDNAEIWLFDGSGWVDCKAGLHASVAAWATLPGPPSDIPNELGPIELDILDELHERLLAGQKQYGAFSPIDSRNWTVETKQELLDALVYLVRAMWRMR